MNKKPKGNTSIDKATKKARHASLRNQGLLPLRIPETNSKALILKTLHSFRARGSQEGHTRIPINNTIFEAKKGYYALRKPHNREEIIEGIGIPSLILGY